jgi:FKBP-type peptidyl-prolyl cis-trans isomerase
MEPIRFRPRLEAVEDRVTPAVTPTEVFFAAFQTGQTREMLVGLLDHLDEPMNVYEKPFWASFLPSVVQESRAAHNDLAEFANALQTQLEADAVLADALAPSLANARALQAQAANNAHAAGVIAIHFGVPETVVFPVPTVPPPPAPFPGGAPFPDEDQSPETDSGMTDTQPSLAAEEWEDIGDGLRVWDVVEGNGEEAVAGDNVSAHYTGWASDGPRAGQVFDSSRSNFGGDGSPRNFSLNQVIQGWIRGIPGMKVGGIRRLDIPAELAYGELGSPPGRPADQQSVLPNTRLVFEVKLADTGESVEL